MLAIAFVIVVSVCSVASAWIVMVVYFGFWFMVMLESKSFERKYNVSIDRYQRSAAVISAKRKL